MAACPRGQLLALSFRVLGGSAVAASTGAQKKTAAELDLEHSVFVYYLTRRPTFSVTLRKVLRGVGSAARSPATDISFSRDRKVASLSVLWQNDVVTIDVL